MNFKFLLAVLFLVSACETAPKQQASPEQQISIESALNKSIAAALNQAGGGAGFMAYRTSNSNTEDNPNNTSYFRKNANLLYLNGGLTQAREVQVEIRSGTYPLRDNGMPTNYVQLNAVNTRSFARTSGLSVLPKASYASSTFSYSEPGKSDTPLNISDLGSDFKIIEFIQTGAWLWENAKIGGLGVWESGGTFAYTNYVRESGNQLYVIGVIISGSTVTLNEDPRNPNPGFIYTKE